MNTLLREFENMLDTEAKKIVNEMINMYYKKVIVNKTYSQIVRSLVPKELEYYTVAIELRTYHFLPTEFYPDFNSEYTLCKKEEYVEDHLLKYCEYCKENNDKDHSKMAHIIAERLVQYLKENPDSKKNLLELVAIWTQELLPKHNDSVDVETIMLFLQTEIEDLGYQVIEINPLIIEKII